MYNILRAGKDRRKLDDIIMKFKNHGEAGIRDRARIG
jgi:hypothetical protein